MNVDGIIKVEENLIDIRVLIQHLLVKYSALIRIQLRTKGRHELECLPERLLAIFKLVLELHEARKIGKQIL